MGEYALNMRHFLIILMVILLIFTVCIAGCGAPSTKTSNIAPSSVSNAQSSVSNYAPSSIKELTFTAANPDFVFSNIKMSDDINYFFQDYTYLTGKIQNVASTVKESTKIKVYFYDKDGVRLGDASDTISNLKPGETAVFRINVDDKNLIKNSVKVDLEATKAYSLSNKKLTSEFVFSDSKIITKSSGSTYFTGKIQNVGSTLHEKVTIKAYLYDKDGIRIGDATTNISNLKPGEIAIFEMYLWYTDNVNNIVKWEMTVEDFPY